MFKAKRNLTLHLMNKARRTYNTQFIVDNSSDQSKLFRASKSLLNLQADRALPPHNDALSLANEMGEFFIRKITAIRSQLGANGKSVSRDVTCEPATVELRSDRIELSQFQPLSEETVRQMALANSKSCALDLLPSAVLSTCIDELLPVITKMVNLSLETGCFVEVWKNALVHPLLKKQGLQLVNKNFRPVSNLQFTSKLNEKAAVQLQDHMLNNNLFPKLQSAYRQHHSTETALFKVKNDILMSMDKGHVTLLVLLDLRSAFDTVDHRILLNRLQSSLGVRGKAFSWFKSY